METADQVGINLKEDLIYKIINDSHLKFIKPQSDSNFWKLSEVYQLLKEDYSKYTDEKKAEFIKSYKDVALQKIEVKNAHKSTQGLTDFFSKYIMKKRSALVYVCLLYLDTINRLKTERQEGRNNLLDEILTASEAVIDAYNSTQTQPPGSQGTSQGITKPSKPENVPTSLGDLATKIAALKKAMDDANKAREEQEKLAKEREDLLGKIIPFIASQTEIDEPLAESIK